MLSWSPGLSFLPQGFITGLLRKRFYHILPCGPFLGVKLLILVEKELSNKPQTDQGKPGSLTVGIPDLCSQLPTNTPDSCWYLFHPLGLNCSDAAFGGNQDGNISWHLGNPPGWGSLSALGLSHKESLWSFSQILSLMQENSLRR